MVVLYVLPPIFFPFYCIFLKKVDCLFKNNIFFGKCLFKIYGALPRSAPIVHSACTRKIKRKMKGNKKN